MRFLSARVFGAAVVVVALVACGDKSSSTGVDVAKERSAMEQIARDIEKEIPGSVKPPITFEVVDLGDGTSALSLQPKGWAKRNYGGVAAPAELGATTFWASSNCDGLCEKKDWSAVA